MFTADEARQLIDHDLDGRIKRSVKERREGNGAYLRVYHDDSFIRNIHEELKKRGFTNINVPDICLSGDVYFEWGSEDDE